MQDPFAGGGPVPRHSQLYQTVQSVKTDQSVWNRGANDGADEPRHAAPAVRASGRHRRRPRDRPHLPPRRRPARLRGVPARRRRARAASCCCATTGSTSTSPRGPGHALQLETPTWRASRDWGDRLGYSARRPAPGEPSTRCALLAGLRDEAGLETFLISGYLGPRGDGYVAGDVVDPDDAAAYHAPQIEAFAEAGVDLVTVLTLTGTGEAIGIVRAARAAGLPVAVSFTVEQDGRLPGRHALAAAITAGRRRGRARLLHGQLRPPDPHRTRAGRATGTGVHASSGSARTPRPSVTRSSTRPPSSTRATRSSSPRAHDALRPHLPNLASSAAAAAPTPATSPRCGASGSHCPAGPADR